jgi:hypothetical protein
MTGRWLIVIVGTIALTACTVAPNPTVTLTEKDVENARAAAIASATAAAAAEPRRPPPTSELVANAQYKLNRFGYAIDANLLTTDQLVRMQRVNTFRVRFWHARRQIDSILARTIGYQNVWALRAY